jgi:hypothetical protein
MEVKRLEFQTSANGKPGDLGFKLTGVSEDGSHFARVWVRKLRGPNRQVWTRYIAPVPASTTWEVRLHELIGTGSMARVEFRSDVLARFAEEYVFPKSAQSSAVLNAIETDDPVFSEIRDWAAAVTAAQA